MKVLYLISAVVVLAPSVLAESFTGNINNQTDQALSQVNKFLTERGFGLHPIPPIVYDDIQLFEGVIVGLNSQYRTRDSSASQNDTNNATSVDLHVGLRLYSLAFGRIDNANQSYSGVFRVRNNSFHIAFTIFREQRCRVQLSKYEYEELSGATLSTSLPEFDDFDVSDVFTEIVLPRINAVVARKKPRVEKVLQHAICGRPHPHHEALHQLLAEAFVSHVEL